MIPCTVHGEHRQLIERCAQYISSHQGDMPLQLLRNKVDAFCSDQVTLPAEYHTLIDQCKQYIYDNYKKIPWPDLNRRVRKFCYVRRLSGYNRYVREQFPLIEKEKSSERLRAIAKNWSMLSETNRKRYNIASDTT